MRFYFLEKCPNTWKVDVNNITKLMDKCHEIYHKKCLDVLKDNCEHCLKYLSLNIEKNITSLKKRLFAPLKDNEKPLIENENNNDDINNDDNENIENILERVESSIDN